MNILKTCNKCSWMCTTRTQVVTGIGPTDAQLMLIGEAPGENEDLLGEPFMGRAGDLLNKILKETGIDRNKIYITNTVKCRPTEKKGKRLANRAPTQEEIDNCKSWLWKEIKLIKPRLIVTLGKVPTRTLLSLPLQFKMGDYVGKVCEPTWNIEGEIPTIIPCFHPSYLLQHGRRYLDDTKQHFKQIKKEIDAYKF